MRRSNPFAPIATNRNEQPIVVRRDRRAVSVEDHLAGASATGKISPDRLKLRLGQLILLLAFSVVGVRIVYLQVARGEEYRAASEQNRIRLEVIRAPRGIILDRHRDPLLMNVANFTLFATPADLPRTSTERRDIANQLTTALPSLDAAMTEQALAGAVLGSLKPIILAEHVPYQDALKLATVTAQLPGISLETVATRSYVDGEASAHLVGYLGKPTEKELANDPDLSPFAEIGRMGVEQQYDEILRGTDGVREVERDHLNKELNIVDNREPIPGKNLVLTIDKGLQNALSSALKDTVTRLRVPGGSAVAIDPRSGAILAIASQPSFNPNLFTTGGTTDEFAAVFDNPNHPLFFRPISGTYPSGSTIKPLVATAALAEGVVSERTTINSSGGFKVGPNFFPDWKSGGHGATDVRKALAESVNTFFYTVGGGHDDVDGLGIDRLISYFQMFGLGQKLGVDLPAEATGFIPTAEWRNRPNGDRWYLGDTYHLSIGQGFIDVTPLQVASYTSAIANGGKLFQPHVLSEVLNPDGTLDQAAAPAPYRTTVDDRFLAVVRSGMRQAVTSGSARALGDLPVPAAAKTGTAQFGEGDRTHAWLTSFAPFDRPEIVITVVVEQGGEGHAEALPIAKAGLKYYFEHPSGTP